MSDERLAEIRTREQAAQRGPWSAEDGALWAPAYDHIAVNTRVGWDVLSCCNIDDLTLEFIAQARADVPWLLAEVDRLGAIVALDLTADEAEHILTIRKAQAGRRDADDMEEPSDLQAALSRIDAHPTPLDDNGNCFYCAGGLGHGPHGHREDCPLVVVRRHARGVAS